MAYTKVWPEGWKDNEEGGTYIDAAGLNKMEQGIMDAHTFMERKDNPHGVTKAQVGLNNVPNVATNDQTPTYTAAGTLSALTSGEKLSAAFGKLAKAVTDLISHLADNVKHITAAERTAWNAKPTGVKGNAESVYRSGNVNLTPANIGAVPTTRTVNGMSLSTDVTLTAEDVGAADAEKQDTINKALADSVGRRSGGLIVTESGNPLTLAPDTTMSAPFDSLILSGSTIQDGTPSPEAPVPVTGLGELQPDGTYSLSLTAYGRNLLDPASVTLNKVLFNNDYLANSKTGFVSGHIPVDPEKAYRIMCIQTDDMRLDYAVCRYNAEKTMLTRVYVNKATELSSGYVVYADGAAFIRFSVGGGPVRDWDSAFEAVETYQVGIYEYVEGEIPVWEAYSASGLPAPLYEGDTLDFVSGSVTRYNGVIASYDGESVPGKYVSSTGGLDSGATVVYRLTMPVTTTATLTGSLSAPFVNPLILVADGNLSATYHRDPADAYTELYNVILSMGGNVP